MLFIVSSLLAIVVSQEISPVYARGTLDGHFYEDLKRET
jgi:hypothetical protein